MSTDAYVPVAIVHSMHANAGPRFRDTNPAIGWGVTEPAAYRDQRGVMQSRCHGPEGEARDGDRASVFPSRRAAERWAEAHLGVTGWEKPKPHSRTSTNRKSGSSSSAVTGPLHEEAPDA